MTELLITLAFYIAFLILGAVLTWFLLASAIKRAYRIKAAVLWERAEAVNENERLKLQLANQTEKITHLLEQIEAMEFSEAMLSATVKAKHEPSRC